ncbi:MAG: hypothetical protein K2X82_03740 [Gemmataceae bacterium]|nr:hypothetical protein [Gemmataceae bacterium]
MRYLLLPAALALSAARGAGGDLADVRAALADRERARQPVHMRYAIDYDISPAYLTSITASPTPLDRGLAYREVVEYVRKGERVIQRVTGPKIQPPARLADRARPEWALFDGASSFRSERPDYVLTCKGYQMVVRDPDDYSGERTLRQIVAEAVAGNMTLASIRDEPGAGGEAACRLEFVSQDRTRTTVSRTHPHLSHAVASLELFGKGGVALWRHSECRYREVGGVAYLEAAKFQIYDGADNKRTLLAEDRFTLEFLETDPRKIPDSLFEVQIDRNATVFDEDLRSPVASADRIQAVLDAASAAAAPTAESSRWWWWLAAAVAVGGILVAVRRARRPA